MNVVFSLQREVIEQFRKNDIKVLISTAIIEEGYRFECGEIGDVELLSFRSGRAGMQPCRSVQ